ncbi:MAG: aromatic amino acid transport family protein [Gammaproteobacteria bacterium]
MTLPLRKNLGAALLISGTSIGGAMLSIPLETANLSLAHTFLVLIAVWFMAWISASFLLEANLWQRKNADFNSLAAHYLGFSGKIITKLFYLALLYALIGAYLLGLLPWWKALFSALFAQDTPSILSKTPLFPYLASSLIVGLVVVQGTARVAKINRWISLLMFSAYVLILIAAWPKLNFRPLFQTPFQSDSSGFSEFMAALNTLPLIVTSFGFSIVIPSLCTYLKFNAKELKRNLFWGSILPLICYMSWQFTVFSLIPKEQLIEHKGHGIAFLLQDILSQKWQLFAFHLFELSAILTSFLGVTQGLYHFLQDALPKLKYSKYSKIKILSLAFGPAVLIAIIHQNTFSKVLGFAGLLVAVLLGIIPSLFSLQGLKSNPLAPVLIPGAKLLRILVILFFTLVILVEINPFTLPIK